MIAMIDDIEIGFDDAGSGVPLLLVHGFPHDRRLWAPQVHGLVDSARCLAVDLRGFGDTTPAPPWSMDRYADDLAALLNALRLDRVVLAGVSMGGYVAFAFWRRHQERVRALVLASTRAGADTEEGRERRSAMIALARERGVGAVAEAMMPGMIGKTTREKNPEVAEAVHRMLISPPVEGVVGALQAMRDRPDSTATLPTIDVPTLVIAGDEDALIPVREARAVQALIAGSVLEVIAGAGHLSNMERPDAFNHLLSEFVGRVTLT